MKRLLYFSWWLGISTHSFATTTVQQHHLALQNDPHLPIGICDSVWADFFYFWQSDTLVCIADNCGNNVTYHWDFGDSQHAYGRYVQHLYQDSGYYQVRLAVFNSCGDTAITSQYLRFCKPPRALFYYTILQNNSQGMKVEYNAGASQYAQNFYWDFGDGHRQSGGVKVQHHYAAPLQTYQVRLMVDNKCGWLNQYLLVLDGRLSDAGLVSREIEIFPNPARDYLQLRMSEDLRDWQYEIYRNDCPVLLGFPIGAKGGWKLDIRSLSAGFYVLILRHLNSGEFRISTFVKRP